MARYWQQAQLLATPDRLMETISIAFRGNSESLRSLRRTIGRYVNLMNALGWRHISTKIMKRFPTVHHFVEAGFMSESEYELYQAYKIADQERHLVPLLWTLRILAVQKKNGAIDPTQFRQATAEAIRMKDCVRKVQNYTWVCIPLVYTQVRIVTIWLYTIACTLDSVYCIFFR